MHNADIDRVAADLGYTHHHHVERRPRLDWRTRERNQPGHQRREVFQPQQIVLTHANLPTVTHCYPQLLDLIQTHNLPTVTLNDVFT